MQSCRKLIRPKIKPLWVVSNVDTVGLGIYIYFGKVYVFSIIASYLKYLE